MGGVSTRVPASPRWRLVVRASPLAPACGLLPAAAPAPVRSYHGEAHVGLLERRPVVGAVPRHGHHLPLLRVRAVDDACGRGGRVLRALGPPWGRGPRLAQPPPWPLPRHPPDSIKLHPSSQHLQETWGPLAQCWLQLTLPRWGLLPLQGPLCSLQPMATAVTTLAKLTSPVQTPGASLFSREARFGQGATHLLRQHLVLGAGGQSHLRRPGLCHLLMTTL